MGGSYIAQPDGRNKLNADLSHVTAVAARTERTTRRTRAFAKSATYIVPSGVICKPLGLLKLANSEGPSCLPGFN